MAFHIIFFSSPATLTLFVLFVYLFVCTPSKKDAAGPDLQIGILGD